MKSEKGASEGISVAYLSHSRFANATSRFGRTSIWHYRVDCRVCLLSFGVSLRAQVPDLPAQGMRYSVAFAGMCFSFDEAKILLVSVATHVPGGQTNESCPLQARTQHTHQRRHGPLVPISSLSVGCDAPFVW